MQALEVKVATTAAMELFVRSCSESHLHCRCCRNVVSTGRMDFTVFISLLHLHRKKMPLLPKMFSENVLHLPLRQQFCSPCNWGNASATHSPAVNIFSCFLCSLLLPATVFSCFVINVVCVVAVHQVALTAVEE